MAREYEEYAKAAVSHTVRDWVAVICGLLAVGLLVVSVAGAFVWLVVTLTQAGGYAPLFNLPLAGVALCLIASIVERN